jgi:Protein of unknown function (DUF1573)
MKNSIKISMLAFALGLMSFSSINSPKSLIFKTIVETAPISWKSESIDVGEIPQNTPKVIEYEFKNTGKTTVLITNVKGSCGCTATDYTKTPILPGKSGQIKATFNAANKGAFSKTVTVTTNAETNPKVLTFKGTVL